MATFKHISSKNADYGAAEQYLTFEHDGFTMKPTLDENGQIVPRTGYLISSLNCGDEDFAIACMRSNLKYGKNQKREDVKSHHYIISFDPRDAPDNGLTVDRAQALGEEFCKTHFPGHQALVCTHPDGHNHSGNIHVHIVINSLRIAEVPLLPYMERPADTREGCKHRCTDAAMEYFKAEVMEMCHRENLYQIDLLHGSKNRVTEREYWAKRKGQAALDKENASQAATGEPPKQTKFETDKEKLRRTIRAALSSAVSFEDFSGKLLQQGVTVKKSRGRLSYLTPDRTKPITARKLGDDFDRAAVLETLTQNAQNAARAAEKPLPKQEYPRSIKDRLQRNKAAVNAPKNDGVHEVAHAKLHAREAEQDTEKAVYKDRETKEVEAESIAYTVCQHFGIDTSDYSFGYIAGWSSGKEMPELKSSLDTIRRTSSELIKGIETQLLEIEKERAAEQAQEDILLLVANTDRSEYDLLNVKGMERADLLNELLSMKDDDRQSVEAYLERAGAWVTPLANERSEGVGEYHLDYAYNTDTHEITNFKALQEEREKANIPIEYGDVIVRISTPDSGEYETIKITNMQSEVQNALYDVLMREVDGQGGKVLDYLQEKGFEFVPIMRSGGLNDGYPQFYDFDVDMSELEVHTASELPATVQAEQLINRMEFHRSVYDTDERNLIMNHAYKLDDMYKTTSLAHSIAEQKDDLPLLWETIRTAEEEIDALPDGMAGLSQMHEYGYSWDEMLPLTKDKASELFGEDVAVYQLHADASETLVEDRAALEGHDGLFGVEKNDWNAYKEYQSMKQELEDSEANKEVQLLYGNGGSKDIGEVPVMDSTAEVPENTVESGIQGEPDSDKFTYYVIEDLSARVGNNPEKGEVERFGNLAEAIGRFKEYREREDADQTGMTKAVFGFGINGKEFDVLHVKNNQNCVPLEFTQKKVEHSQFKSDLQALYYEVGFDRAEIYRERLPEETKDLVKELFEIQLKTSGINNVSLYMDRFDTLYEQGKMEKLIPKGEQNYVLENIPFVEWKNPYIDVNARETAEQAQEGKQTVVTLTVAECGEFHNLGEYHENIAGVEEAIAIFNRISPDRMNGIPSIGINIHTEGTESYEDTQMDIVSGGVADLEFLDYVPDIAGNPQAMEVIVELLGKLPEVKIDGIINKALEEKIWEKRMPDLEPAMRLAVELDLFAYHYDTYHHDAGFDSMEDSIPLVYDMLNDGQVGNLEEWLNEVIAEGALPEEEKQAKELLEKLAEYKPLAKVEELEECNYNMIDNVLNNEKPKEEKEKQSGRISIKEKLAEKKEVTRQRDKAEREVPEKGTEKKSEREI